MPKQLFILRHAQAGGSAEGGDHARPLTRTGETQAEAVGRWLMSTQRWPEMVLVSDAMRTRQTWVWVGHQLGEKAATPYLEPRLYQAEAAGMCAVINETPESAQSLLVVAHMPGVQELSMRLSSVDSEETAVLSMAEHWPTAGCAVFEVNKRWAELDGRDAKLTEFVT